MSEFDAPLAYAEEDWADFDEQTSNQVNFTRKNSRNKELTDAIFSDAHSDSLEDLVNSFDEKITNCFKNYDENTENLAPVQIRSQEEIINECQIWWNLTGSFGNVMPIDWTKTRSRSLHLPVLNLNKYEDGRVPSNAHNSHQALNLDEEELSKDFDLHSLIISSYNGYDHSVISVDDVLEEIDDLMQNTAPNSSGSGSTDISTPSSTTSPQESLTRQQLAASVEAQKLRLLSVAQLNEYFVELERKIQTHSSTLIQELALRDELEYEKELKNTFISLLLSVQNKKRQLHIDRKKGNNVSGPKFLTTIIPFDPDDGPPNVITIQFLIKILKAINQDSPTVPTLLTEYILKVFCPS